MEEIREETPKEDQAEDKPEEETKEAEEIAKETEKKQESAEEEMLRMQQELSEARDMMLRLAAEMDNYKKRTMKERESLVKYATQGIIEDLLPVLDNFQRAIESASDLVDQDSFLEGVKMIYKQMHDVLEKKGVKRIDAVGETFDPNIHEAVMQIASEEHPENVVVEEFQKGYMLHDRVIRPAMVAVSKGAKEE